VRNIQDLFIFYDKLKDLVASNYTGNRAEGNKPQDWIDFVKNSLRGPYCPKRKSTIINDKEVTYIDEGAVLWPIVGGINGKIMSGYGRPFLTESDVGRYLIQPPWDGFGNIGPNKRKKANDLLDQWYEDEDEDDEYIITKRDTYDVELSSAYAEHLELNADNDHTSEEIDQEFFGRFKNEVRTWRRATHEVTEDEFENNWDMDASIKDNIDELHELRIRKHTYVLYLGSTIEPEYMGMYTEWKSSHEKIAYKPINRANIKQVEIDAYINTVSKAFKCFVFSGRQSTCPNVLASFDRMISSHCEVCDRTHEKKGAYIWANQYGGVALMCAFAKGTREKPNRLMVLKKNKPPGYDITLNIDGHDTILSGIPEVKCFNSRYINDNVPNDGVTDIYLKSKCGTGKTVMLVDIVKKTAGKILLICSRISQSSQYCKQFGAKSYREINGIINFKNYNVVAIQVDSLSRVKNEIDDIYDLVVIDEVAQLNAHCGMSDRGVTFNTQLASIVRKAKRLIVTDNDLTEGHIRALLMQRENKPRQIYYNTYANEVGTIGIPVDIIVGKHGVIKQEERLYGFVEEQYQLMKSGSDDWRGCIVPTHSKTHSQEIYKQLVKKYGDEHIAVYHSETDDKKKKADFADA